MTQPKARPEDLLTFDLTDDEREVLGYGLNEWRGPARCTQEMAVAMGFAGIEDLFDNIERLLPMLKRKEPLSRLDWTRTLLAVEIAWASDVLGSGLDWSTGARLSDDYTLPLVRSIQGKLVRATRWMVGHGLGTHATTCECWVCKEARS